MLFAEVIAAYTRVFLGCLSSYRLHWHKLGVIVILGWYFDAIETLFLGIYMMEILLKLYVYRLHFFKDPWNNLGKPLSSPLSLINYLLWWYSSVVNTSLVLNQNQNYKALTIVI